MADTLEYSPVENEARSNNSRLIRRTPEQEQARAQSARKTLSSKAVNLSRNQSNGRGTKQQIGDEENKAALNQAQIQNTNRFYQAQVVLASQEETDIQIKNEEEGRPNLIRYSPAFAVAVFKDFILDFSLLGTLPVIGTVLSFICSSLIFILLVFAKKNSSFQDMRFIIRRLLIVLAAFLIEGFVFGVNFLPFEVLTVVVIYFMDKSLSDKQIAFLQDLAHGLRRKRV